MLIPCPLTPSGGGHPNQTRRRKQKKANFRISTREAAAFTSQLLTFLQRSKKAATQAPVTDGANMIGSIIALSSSRF